MTQAAILAASGSPGTTTGFKNRIINGAMVIDQRNNGASSTCGADQTFITDRFSVRNNTTLTNKISAQQNQGSVTAPAGFTNYLGVTSQSAYSVATGDYFAIQQSVEGFNSADLNFGTSNAKTITISFWVRSSLTGTFGGALGNGAYNRSYPFTYTISAANTWQQISITIPGDTTGTWVGATNGTGLQLFFGLGVGSSNSATAGSWQAVGAVSATGATSVVGTSGATFYITGVQLEVGTTATNFDFRSYGTELQLCQRYYYQHASYAFTGGAATIGLVAFNTATDGRIMLTLPTTMRTYPSLVQGSGSNYYIMFCNSNNSYFSSFTGITSQTQQTAELYIQGASALTAGFAGYSQCQNAGSFIAFSAEL